MQKYGDAFSKSSRVVCLKPSLRQLALDVYYTFLVVTGQIQVYILSLCNVFVFANSADSNNSKIHVSLLFINIEENIINTTPNHAFPITINKMFPEVQFKSS